MAVTSVWAIKGRVDNMIRYVANPDKTIDWDTKHPNFKLTPEGGGKPYIHGEDSRSFASFSIDQSLLAQAQEWEIDTTSFVLLSEEELEESFTKKEKENHETVQEKRKGPHRKAPRPRQG